jgi:hypothetical protein
MAVPRVVLFGKLYLREYKNLPEQPSTTMTSRRTAGTGRRGTGGRILPHERDVDNSRFPEFPLPPNQSLLPRKSRAKHNFGKFFSHSFNKKRKRIHVKASITN